MRDKEKARVAHEPAPLNGSASTASGNEDDHVGDNHGHEQRATGRTVEPHIPASPSLEENAMSEHVIDHPRHPIRQGPDHRQFR